MRLPMDPGTEIGGDATPTTMVNGGNAATTAAGGAIVAKLIPQCGMAAWRFRCV